MILQELQSIISELNATLKHVSIEDADEAVNHICTAPKIFLAGVGRSGYMMKAFTMRLMHSGLNAFVIGDTETPKATKNDLLILGSGSGETESLLAIAKKAKKIGLHIIVITGFPKSSLGILGSEVIQISAPTPKSSNKNNFNSVQPMGSLFEQSLLIYLDALVLEIMDRKNLNGAAMFSRHANLE